MNQIPDELLDQLLEGSEELEDQLGGRGLLASDSAHLTRGGLSPATNLGSRLSHLLEAVCGPLGVAAPLRLGPRDRFLRWDPRTCGAGIVNNDCFLLVDGVQLPNLAPRVLGQAARRLTYQLKGCAKTMSSHDYPPRGSAAADRTSKRAWGS